MKVPILLSFASTLLMTANSLNAEATARSIEIGPDYQDAAELHITSEIQRGTIEKFVMESKDSALYPGIAKNREGTVPYSRKVAVYLPFNLDSNKTYPLLVVQDGTGYIDVVSKSLDALIAQKRVPAMVAILIASGGGDAQGSERGLEYDTLSGKYAEFIETEVIPRVEKDYKVKITTDPEGRATMGGSSGAAAAFTMAWFRPDLYHRVLSYSGTFVNQQSPLNPESPHGAWEYHENLIPNAAKKPIRIWMEVSEHDNGYDRDEASLHNWVMANDRMAEVLKAKGYEYRYVFAKDAGHTDGRVTKQTLPAALEWLWQSYPR
ncbi:esterase family protein [Luteolibacter pohnpeiensis]|uniref:Esterase family protein n=1 Tax=Luteolibacter pohnpeiensis TaxID=454153 RepID=A0A934S9C3_9BACT|nr:alpha/beta hydrolase-fold protein [Luteolibacter pohnpeiensis]MBK1883261.1 esterase family protein [Luteolibacter pohnpeiensis]